LRAYWGRRFGLARPRRPVEAGQEAGIGPAHSGAIDLGESVAQAAVRETLEESDIDCAITGIVGIYSDPEHVILYTSNGEARQEFSIVLTARPLRGEPTPSSESSEVRWVPESELPLYAMDRSMRIRINDFLARKETPVIT